jgi:hypothetical protein
MHRLLRKRYRYRQPDGRAIASSADIAVTWISGWDHGLTLTYQPDIVS